MPLADLKLLEEREGPTLEFINRYNVEHILRVVCAFANGEGGRILVRVDERGRPQGVPQVNKLTAQLQHALFERLQLPVICTVSIVADDSRQLLLEVAGRVEDRGGQQGAGDAARQRHEKQPADQPDVSLRSRGYCHHSREGRTSSGGGVTGRRGPRTSSQSRKTNSP